MKRIISILLVFVMTFGLFSGANLQVTEAAAEEYEQIYVDEQYTAASGKTYYKFIPAESGWYRFASVGYGYADGAILDSDFKTLICAYNWHPLWHYCEPLKLDYRLEAGETYYLEVLSEGVEVTITKMAEATSIQIENSEKVSGDIGDEVSLNVSYLPEGSTGKVVSWTSSDTDVVQVIDNDTLFYRGIGSSTITATTDTGLSDTIIVQVSACPELKVGSPVSLSSLSPNNYHVMFVPEKDGKYAISSNGANSFNLLATLYDDQFNSLSNNTVNGNVTSGFYFERNMKAGEVYYIEAKALSDDVMESYTIIAKLLQSDIERIEAGNEKEVSISTAGEEVYYLFQPTESGWYKYYSDGNRNVQGHVCNIGKIHLYSSQNYQLYYGQYEITGDFSITYYFNAGGTYYLSSQMSRRGTGSYKVGIFKVSPATEISLGSSETYTGKLGETGSMTVRYTPADCEPETVNWSSSNTDIVRIDSSGKMHFKALGSSIITATTDNGLTDSIEVVVVDYPEIELNTEVVDFAGDGQKSCYKFVPGEDGTYVFSAEVSDSRISTYGHIRDENFDTIAATDKYDWNFIISSNMEAGKAYYVDCYTTGGCIMGDVTLKLEKVGGLTNIGSDGIDRTDNLWQTGEDVIIDQVEEIKNNQVKQVDINIAGAKSIFKFIPEEDGEYIFYSIGDEKASKYITDENMERITKKDTDTGYMLTAGKTYLLHSTVIVYDNDKFGSYEVTVEKLPKASSIVISGGGKIAKQIGHRQQLTVSFLPEKCETESISWKSSDNDIVSVDQAGNIILKNIGSATITVTGDSGLTGEILIEVIHYPEISVENYMTSESDEKKESYTFIPEKSGIYTVAVTGDSQMLFNGSISDIHSKEYASSMGRGSLEVSYEMWAGEVYYINAEVLGNHSMNGTTVSVNMDSELENFIKGDVNSDGKINAEDALLALKYSAKMIEFDQKQMYLCDYVSDDSVDARDALQMLKVAANIN